MPNFQIASISQIAEKIVDTSSIVSSCVLAKPAPVSISPIEFGAITRPISVRDEWPQGDWNRSDYQAEPVVAYRMTGNIKVFSELGIVIIDDNLVVEESLHFVFPDHYGWPITQASDGVRQIAIDIPESCIGLGKSLFHLLAGHTGNRNYAHFWTDCISSLEFLEAAEEAFTSQFQLLLPAIRAGYQREVFNSFFGRDHLTNSFLLEETSLVGCDSLVFIPSCKRQDYIPRPSYSCFLQELASNYISVSESDCSSLVCSEPLYIYISRKDAPARKLENEDSIEELLVSKGFRVIQASKLSLREQIRLFSRATILVSAHGAGLANLLFMKRNSIVIEMHCNDMVNWSLRRLASSVGLRYGCLVGSVAVQSPALSFQEKTWSVPLDVLSDAVDAAIQSSSSI